MTDDQARILSAEMDAIQQELAELRARDRARAMETRHALLILVGALEKQLGISPTTKECRDSEKAHRKESW